MKKSKFTEEQMAYALRQAEGGTPVGDICRKLGPSPFTPELSLPSKFKTARLMVGDVLDEALLEPKEVELLHP